MLGDPDAVQMRFGLRPDVGEMRVACGPGSVRVWAGIGLEKGSGTARGLRLR